MAGDKGVHVAESVAFLRDQPLDLRQWTVDNSKREDVELVRRPMLEPLQTSRMLPPSERGVMRWDKNPWEVISGDFGDPQGSKESSGALCACPGLVCAASPRRMTGRVAVRRFALCREGLVSAAPSGRRPRLT